MVRKLSKDEKREIEYTIRATKATIDMLIDHWFNTYSEMVERNYKPAKHTIDYFW